MHQGAIKPFSSTMQEMQQELEQAHAALEQAANDKMEATWIKEAAAQATAAAEQLEQQVRALDADLTVKSQAIQDLENRCCLLSQDSRPMCLTSAAPRQGVAGLGD